MIAWLGYLLAVSALLAVAARLGESLLALYGRPVRWVWLAALSGPLVVPWIAPRATPVAAPASVPSEVVATLDPSLLARLQPTAGMEVLLERAWLVSTVAALLLLAGWFLALSLMPRRWPRRRVDDEDVRVSATAGPAVFGVLLPSIVVPGWLLDCPAEVRRLALLHEREHIAARDPALLAAGAFLVALVPWNPIAWWLLVRLRGAVEIDCDRRVLGRGADVRAYGTMLLGVAGRGTAPLAAVALVEPAVLLERRIVAMTRKPIRRRAARAFGLLSITGLAIFAACRMDAPTSPEPLVEPAYEAVADAPAKVQLDGYIGRLTRIVGELKTSYDLGDGQLFELRTDDSGAQLEILETELRALKEKAPEGVLLRKTELQGSEGRVVDESLRAVEVEGYRTREDGVAKGTLRLRRKADAPASIELRDGISVRTGGGTDPIFILDGKPITDLQLEQISPDDIDRIEVLKGGAAERLYGPDAANGVVSVFLKKKSGSN